MVRQQASSLVKMLTRSVRRLISVLSRSIGLVEFLFENRSPNFWRVGGTALGGATKNCVAELGHYSITVGAGSPDCDGRLINRSVQPESAMTMHRSYTTSGDTIGITMAENSVPSSGARAIAVVIADLR
jgi:hypothetical protein